MRLFVAVSLPTRVVGMLRRLDRPAAARLRWTTPDQWHVTLRFLGEVADPGPAAAALAAVPAELRATGVVAVEAVLGPAVAWFPGRQVLQVPVAGLDGVADAVARATASWDDQAPVGPFAGHLTLARVRGREPGPAHLAGAALRESWRVEEIELVSSTLGPGGSTYTVLARVPLAPA
ncbi:MAG TPA: RNA 2',3'-cyclic phosphodiesterase [Acidimicrobiales bacterium]|nr:RNA 2',3'-cyclic phosphodiesterase [Acidimicrobiales bacterium]